METIWFISLIVLWGVVLVNLLLTLRVVRWLRAKEDLRERVAESEKLPELSIGMPAPDFKAKTLSGEAVRLATYVGRAMVFIFVSPHCGSCRRKMPLLVRLGIQAKERAGIEFVLVSDSSTAETYTWINTIREEDKVEVNLPILVAPDSISEFLNTYNPRGLSPYYCFMNAQGIVQARDPIDMGEWPKLQREWEGSPTTKPFSHLHSRYR